MAMNTSLPTQPSLVHNGRILIYRVFDIGEDINLEQVKQVIQGDQESSPFILHRDRMKAIVIQNAPLKIDFGRGGLDLGGHVFPFRIVGKLWAFGTLSFTFEFQIPKETPLQDIKEMGIWIEGHPGLNDIAKEKAYSFSEKIKNCMAKCQISDLVEDYLLYFLEDVDGLKEDAQKVFSLIDVPSLILSENKEILSERIKASLNDSIFQYSTTDLLVIDWNSALVIEPSGSMDIPDVIEFALNQLLEMRYYDDFLDKLLNDLYNSIESKKHSIFNDKYSDLSEKAGLHYLDISDIIETVENALKVVGDFYLATIFRAANQRFKFETYQRSIDNKLNNLIEFSKLLHSRVSERRSHFLEIIIIVLILLEVIPLFWGHK